MVGSGIKKYAKQNGLTVKNGVAYGIYRGYMLTLQEGAGWKSADFAISTTDELNGVLQGQLGQMLTDETRKEYRIMELGLSKSRLAVKFFDNPGTMGKMEAFIDVICNKLSACEVPGQNYCAHCGQPIDSALSAQDILVGGAVCQMHDGCASSVERDVAAAQEEIKSQGNMVTGIIGAILGGIVGAIPWAFAVYNGWFVGIFGLLIAFAAKKGYELLKGKESKAKAVVIILVAIFSVVVAELGGWVFSLIMEGGTLMESLEYFFFVLSIDGELQTRVISNLLMGLLFAGLGVFDVVRGIFSANSKKNTSVTRM